MQGGHCRLLEKGQSKALPAELQEGEICQEMPVWDRREGHFAATIEEKHGWRS